MQIAIYSGSFDPLHTGHLAILRHLCSCGDYDMVYLIVSPQNPLKDSFKAHNAQERYQAAIEAVARHPEISVRVDDIEMHMPAPHYTIQTLRALALREPGNGFTFVMGADSLADIRRWKDYYSILRDFGVAVFPREGVDLEAVRRDLLRECPDFKIRLIDAPLVNVSSSMIREAATRGEDVSKLLM